MIDLKFVYTIQKMEKVTMMANKMRARPYSQMEKDCDLIRNICRRTINSPMCMECHAPFFVSKAAEAEELKDLLRRSSARHGRCAASAI